MTKANGRTPDYNKRHVQQKYSAGIIIDADVQMDKSAS